MSAASIMSFLIFFFQFHVSTTNSQKFATVFHFHLHIFKSKLGEPEVSSSSPLIHLTFLWEMALGSGRAKQGARGRPRGHSSSPAAAPAPLGLDCDRTLSLELLPLPEPQALTGTKAMPGAFPACLQPPQHHQTTPWVLQEVQRQQQT